MYLPKNSNRTEHKSWVELGARKAVAQGIGHHRLRWCGENRWQYGGGPRAPVQNRCGVEQGLVLLLLLFRILHFVPIGQLSRKGGDLVVPKITSNDLGLDRLGKFDKERYQPGKVFRLGSFLVVVRQLCIILPSIGVGNMRQDKVLAHEANIILRKMPTGYTFLIEVADELLGGRALLRSLQLLLRSATCASRTLRNAAIC